MDRDELVEQLRDSGAEALAAIRSVPAARLDNGAYGSGWTVKQIMAHVASMEFAYRRLPSLASGARDAQAPPGGGTFDMDGYNARQVERRATATAEELADEFARGRGTLIAEISAVDELLLQTSIRTADGLPGTLAEVIVQTAVDHVRSHSADLSRVAAAEPTPGERAAAALVIAAEEIAAVLAAATDEQWRRHPSAEDWSAAGISGHLIELMPFWAGQIELLVGRPDAQLGRAIDAPERIGAIVNGETMTPQQAAEAVRGAATAAGPSLRRIPAGAWSQAVRHQRFGEMTLGGCVETLLVQHSRDHIRQIAMALTPPA
jgi:DinB superfamily/Mycothiol maleylpyruvate isomerase N-terminal domain